MVQAARSAGRRVGFGFADGDQFLGGVFVVGVAGAFFRVELGEDGDFFVEGSRSVTRWKSPAGLRSAASLKRALGECARASR